MKILYGFRFALIFCFLLFGFTVTVRAQQIKLEPVLIPDVIPVTKGQTIWVDFNNDAKLDLVVMGTDSIGNYSNKLYKGDGLTISPSPLLLPEITPVAPATTIKMQVFDFDNDNKLDIFCYGKNSAGTIGLFIFRQENNGFTEVQHSINLANGGSFVIGDFDNNTTAELICTNIQPGNLTKAYSFSNNTWQEKSVTGLPNLAKSELATFDYNRDGKLDILVLGAISNLNSGLYFAGKGLSFTKQKSNLPALNYHASAILDYNQDGFFDVIAAGTNSAGKVITTLYKNNQDDLLPQLFDFSAINTQTIHTGDLDNDGAMDIVITGTDPSTNLAANRIFFLKKDVLTSDNTLLPAWEDQTLILGDYNENYNLDIFITGKSNTKPKAALLRNITTPGNKPPLFPVAPLAVVLGDSVFFYWKPPHDDTTNPNSLTYNLDIKSAITDNQVLSGDLENTVFRKVVSFGHQGPGTQAKIIGLPQGVYYWKITAIDNSYKTSRKVGPVLDDGSGGGPAIYCPLTFSIYKPEVIKACENELITIKPDFLGGKPVEWLTSTGQSLGVSSNITFTAKNSTFIIARIFLEGGCSEAFGFPITVSPLIKAQLPDEILICNKEEVNLSVTLDPEATITWTSKQKGVLGTSANLSFMASASDKIFVEIKNKLGCITKDSLEIKLKPLVVFSAGSSREICPRDKVVLGGTNLPESEYSFAWKPALNLSSTTARNPIARPDKTTWYNVTATNKITGCTAKDSVEIKVKPKRILNPGADRAICLGNSTSLGGNPTAAGLDPAFTYLWSPATGLNSETSANPVATPSVTTRYRLIVSSVSCPSDTAFVTVTVNQPPISGKVNNYTILAGESVQLNGLVGASYKWTPETNLTNPSLANPTASPLVTTTYKLETTDVNGCSGVNEHVVTVKYTVYVPNFFSPNSDGSNDEFKVYGNGIKNIKFQIYTRTGQLLFETTNIGIANGNGWDGRFKEHDQPNGTYVWSVTGEFVDGTPITFEGATSGKFTLVR